MVDGKIWKIKKKIIINYNEGQCSGILVILNTQVGVPKNNGNYFGVKG